MTNYAILSQQLQEKIESKLQFVSHVTLLGNEYIGLVIETCEGLRHDYHMVEVIEGKYTQPFDLCDWSVNVCKPINYHL